MFVVMTECVRANTRTDVMRHDHSADAYTYITNGKPISLQDSVWTRIVV